MMNIGKQINDIIYAKGAPLGSDEYFEIRKICVVEIDKPTPRLHKELIQEENNKLRRLLSRNYDMIGELMPGIGGLVVDIGELNSLMIENKLMMDSSPPVAPIKSQRIFGE
jgi:hypothetical protein